ncbi:MAG: hypothetical protein JKY53_00205 [Flavobacteriales bacterium]|nr:hypothetical protein [Flavobacteriales bacterium]
MTVQNLSRKNTEGCIANGLQRQVISGLAGGTTARALLASESGSLCMFDSAAGQIYTLPAPVIGLQFDFLVSVAGTSNSYSIDTDAATTFIGGGVAAVSTTVAEGGDSFPATIASTVSCDLDSDVTGRLVGTALSIVCISSTEWVISGVTHGVGTLATPFA